MNLAWLALACAHTPEAPVVDLSTPPTVASAADFEPPTPAEFTLSNGLRVWLVEQPGLPLVSLRLVIPGGSARDTADTHGAANLADNVLKHGAGERDATTFAAEVERLALSLSVYTGGTASTVTRSPSRAQAGPTRPREDPWWSERASFEVQFVPSGIARSSPCVAIPSRESASPTVGRLTVCETVFDSVIMRPRRFMWSGPVHFCARASVPYLDDGMSGSLGSSCFGGGPRGVDGQGGPGPRVRPRIVPLERHLPDMLLARLVVEPPYSPERQTPSTTQLLQRRVSEMLSGSCRVVCTLFTACEATLWSTARVVQSRAP